MKYTRESFTELFQNCLQQYPLEKKNLHTTGNNFLPGYRSGQLMVLYRTTSYSNGGQRYVTLCDCGAIRVVVSSSLKENAKNRITSCNKCALQRAHVKTRDALLGQRFGKLTILSVVPEKRSSNGGYIYKAQCDCGNIDEFPGCELRRGQWRTCRAEAPGRVNDIRGQTFGYLTVIDDVGKRDKNNGSILWLCRCKCGNLVYRRGRSLKDEHVASCGCYLSEYAQQRSDEMMLGKKFGHLTVLSREGYKYQQFQWKCKCDCGTIVYRATQHLKDTHESACPKCAHRNHRNAIGLKIGYVTIIDYIEDDDGYNLGYKCHCDKCNNDFELSRMEWVNASRRQQNNFTCSCSGPIKSHGEHYILNLLQQDPWFLQQQYKIIHDKQFFKDLQLPSGGIGRYDFVITDQYQIPIRIIEYDGIQHFEAVENKKSIFTSTLKERQLNDDTKNWYAYNHKIPLVRIPYYLPFEQITVDLLFSDQYIWLPEFNFF